MKTGKSRRAAGKSALAVAALGLLLASCASIQTDIRYDGQGGSVAENLADLERELVSLRASPDTARLAAARASLTELGRNPSSDQSWKARLLALDAYAALLSGDKPGAARKAAEALAAYPGDELAAVVKARLEPRDEARLALLQEAMQVADGSSRLRAEYGSTLSSLGRFRDALAAFDAALPFLPEEYGFLFAAERDRAWALRDAEQAPAKASAAYLNPSPIPLVGMIALAAQETTALDWFTGGAAWDQGVLFERLKAAGWFADAAAAARSPSTRKDAALFLWSLMARGDARIKARYTARYATRGTSPIPDIAYGSPWFDGVMGTVEEGIMALVDGKRFDPDAPASGLDFFSWLLAAAAWR